jgi:hypothetical protein
MSGTSLTCASAHKETSIKLPHLPPTACLTEAEVAIIKYWITAQGAKYDRITGIRSSHKAPLPQGLELIPHGQKMRSMYLWAACRALRPNITPNEEADKEGCDETVFFDLTGCASFIEMMDRFLKMTAAAITRYTGS